MRASSSPGVSVRSRQLAGSNDISASGRLPDAAGTVTCMSRRPLITKAAARASPAATCALGSWGSRSRATDPPAGGSTGSGSAAINLSVSRATPAPFCSGLFLIDLETTVLTSPRRRRSWDGSQAVRSREWASRTSMTRDYARSSSLRVSLPIRRSSYGRCLTAVCRRGSALNPRRAGSVRLRLRRRSVGATLPCGKVGLQAFGSPGAPGTLAWMPMTSPPGTSDSEVMH